MAPRRAPARRCADCRRWTRGTNSLHLCSVCLSLHRCGVCGIVFPAKPNGSWCIGCRAMLREFRAKNHAAELPRVPAFLREHLLEEFSRRAEHGLPLFGPKLIDDPGDDPGEDRPPVRAGPACSCTRPAAEPRLAALVLSA